MAEFSFDVPPVDIPEQCIGCPRLILEAERHAESLERNENIIAEHASEIAEQDTWKIERFFNMVSRVSEQTVATEVQTTMDDLAQVAAIAKRDPEVAQMPVLDFIRAYRTEENRLGDSSITPLLARLFLDYEDADELAEGITIADATDMAAQVTALTKQDAEHRLLLKPEEISKELERLDTATQLRRELAAQSEESYNTAVKMLIEQCREGAGVKRTGIPRWKASSHCGSLAVDAEERPKA